ncbi:hypothetical protein NDU88_009510 [Pleurodeles waltl]|uniref:Uncharacterized protein n=1 Tax=Pleurodeles waltl TaxID=8319 RepID=A0AAV7NZE1_PLEWA|nr:hypothetical protein NDU88_009510 [Pleurodeles waltl]
MLAAICTAGPSGGDPYTDLTGADAALRAPEVPAKGTNQRSLWLQKAGPAPGTTGSWREEKLASGREATRHGGAGESGADGDDEEDEEKAGRGTESSATREKRGTLRCVSVTENRGTRRGEAQEAEG